MKTITDIVDCLSTYLIRHYYTFNMHETQENVYTFKVKTDIPNTEATITVKSDVTFDNEEFICVYSIISNNNKTLYNDSLVEEEINEDSLWEFIEGFENNLTMPSTHAQEIATRINSIIQYCNNNELYYNDFITIK